MAKLKQLQDSNVDIFPVTHEAGVIDDKGISIKNKYSQIGHKHDASEIDNLPVGDSTPVIDNLTSNSKTSALSANQGNVLNSKIGNLDTRLDGKSFKYLTKEEYDDILEKDPDIVYCVTDEDEVDLSNYLAKDNINEYTPTNDYHPATKKYVDNIAQSSGSGGYKLLTEYVYNQNKVVDIQSLDMQTGIFTTKTELEFDREETVTFRAKDVSGSLKGIPYELKDVLKSYSIVKLTSNTFRINVEGTPIESYDENKVENLDLSSFYIEYNLKEVVLDNINCNNVLIEIAGTRNRAGWTDFFIVTSNRKIETDSVFLSIDGRQWGFIKTSFEIRNFKGIKDHLCSITANGKRYLFDNDRNYYNQNSRYEGATERCFNSETISTVKSFRMPGVFANETSIRIYDLGGN